LQIEYHFAIVALCTFGMRTRRKIANIMGGEIIQDKDFMQLALAEARLAYDKGEVPIGAVVAIEGEVIASAHNLRETSNDPTAHAEILALRQASQTMGRWRLSDARLYVTVEPCPMCAGAIMLARLGALVYGADDPKWGAVRTLFEVINHPRLNHKLEVVSGVLADECRQILQEFFRARRNQHDMV